MAGSGGSYIARILHRRIVAGKWRAQQDGFRSPLGDLHPLGFAANAAPSPIAPAIGRTYGSNHWAAVTKNAPR